MRRSMQQNTTMEAAERGQVLQLSHAGRRLCAAEPQRATTVAEPCAPGGRRLPGVVVNCGPMMWLAWRLMLRSQSGARCIEPQKAVRRAASCCCRCIAGLQGACRREAPVSLVRICLCRQLGYRLNTQLARTSTVQ